MELFTIDFAMYILIGLIFFGCYLRINEVNQANNYKFYTPLFNYDDNFHKTIDRC